VTVGDADSATSPPWLEEHMPYVPPGEALGRGLADLDAIALEMGDAPWRVAVVGTPALRVVLVRWPPGFATIPHVHPHADEIFEVLDGRAVFVMDDRELAVERGAFLHARPGVRHAIRVPGDSGPLTLLAAVAPNEERPDETVDVPDDIPTPVAR
jgi:mannose-6-phosphate isomerase-like protein (cupin superfamily)